MIKKLKLLFNIILFFTTTTILITTIISIKKGIKNNRVEILQNEINQLNQEKSKLQEELVYLDSEEFIEQEARNRLNYTKPNEKILVFPQPEDNKKNIDLYKHTQETSPNYKSWIEIFNLEPFMVKYSK